MKNRVLVSWDELGRGFAFLLRCAFWPAIWQVRMLAATEEAAASSALIADNTRSPWSDD